MDYGAAFFYKVIAQNRFARVYPSQDAASENVRDTQFRVFHQVNIFVTALNHRAGQLIPVDIDNSALPIVA